MPRQLAFVNSITTVAAASGAEYPYLFAAAAFVAVCAVLAVGCASHGSGHWRRRLADYRRRGRSCEPVISTTIEQAATTDHFGAGEVCIWQRGILMGEKCQLPAFSGVIAYDTAGKLLVPGRPCLMKC